MQVGLLRRLVIVAVYLPVLSFFPGQYGDVESCADISICIELLFISENECTAA